MQVVSVLILSSCHTQKTWCIQVQSETFFCLLMTHSSKNVYKNNFNNTSKRAKAFLYRPSLFVCFSYWFQWDMPDIQFPTCNYKITVSQPFLFSFSTKLLLRCGNHLMVDVFFLDLDGVTRKILKCLAKSRDALLWQEGQIVGIFLGKAATIIESPILQNKFNKQCHRSF